MEWKVDRQIGAASAPKGTSPPWLRACPSGSRPRVDPGLCLSLVLAMPWDLPRRAGLSSPQVLCPALPGRDG